MAGDWIKMEAATPDKPEVLAITARMGWDDPDTTVGKLFRVWRWFDQQTIDGNAPGVTKALLDRIACVSGFADAMESVGWLIANEQGLTLPNFEKHCGKTAKERAQTAKRVANHKFKEKGNAGTVSRALPREEKRRSKEDMSGKPDVAGELLDYLNERAGRAYRKVETNLSMLQARLKDSTPDEIRAVIDAKVDQWGDDPKMQEFLRPATLFAARNFENYLGSVGAGPVEIDQFAGAL